MLEQEGKLPTAIIACVGGGSNAIGAFYEFLPDANVQLIGVEAGGRGTGLGEHAARFQKVGGGTPGVLQVRTRTCYKMRPDRFRAHILSRRGWTMRAWARACNAARLRTSELCFVLGCRCAEGYGEFVADGRNSAGAGECSCGGRGDSAGSDDGEDGCVDGESVGAGDKDMGILARELDLKGA